MFRPRWVLMSGAVLGCSSGGGCSGGNGSGSPDLIFADENNYTYDSTLAVQEVEVQSGVSSTISWEGLDVDLRDRPMDPADSDQITLLKFNVPKEELFELFADNDINMDDAPLQYLNNSNGITSIALEDFETVGLLIDLPEVWQEDPSATWLLSIMNTYGARLDILMSKILVPKDASTNTTVAVGNDCTDLTVDVDLQNVEPIVTRAGRAPYSLDWTRVTTDVYGNPYNPDQGDELIIARYDLGLDEIEANFKQLDSVPEVAKELYRMDVLGVTSADLSRAEDAEGNPFGGFTTEGTWLIGVICQTCANPAPLLLGHVEVQAE